jgi:hypothetical protein
MNRTMRTVLSAAAAGALVIGAAGASVAVPASGGHGRGHAKATLTLSNVGIHDHSAINFWDISATGTDSVRSLKVRATVKDKKDVLGDPAPTVEVDLGEFTRVKAPKKRPALVPVVPSVAALDDLVLPMLVEKKNSKYFAVEYTFSQAQKDAIRAHLLEKAAAATAAGVKVERTYLCIIDADVTGAPVDVTVSNSKQSRNRLLASKGNHQRQCVQLIVKDPSTTKTTTDDPH